MGKIIWKLMVSISATLFLFGCASSGSISTEDWTKLSKEEVQALYTNSTQIGQSARGQFKVYWGEGCGKLVAGGGRHIRYRTIEFNEDGSYTITNIGEEPQTFAGVITDGENYRFASDNHKFKVKEGISEKVKADLEEKCSL